MESANTHTMIKLFETLPEQIQEHVLEHMRKYIQEIQDELKWSQSFSRTQNRLVAFAQQAKKEIAEGKATPMDISQL
ncbi:MAG: hypothetical protein HQK63_12960 [Desulfamplus sp.]|nr:hypothetical protein [Desulfamplus sp.]